MDCQNGSRHLLAVGAWYALIRDPVAHGLPQRLTDLCAAASVLGGGVMGEERNPETCVDTRSGTNKLTHAAGSPLSEVCLTSQGCLG